MPVTVKMRRGERDGSRDALAAGPRLVEAGAAALTLHPRSAQQMYTGTADHALTAELVSLVDVPVIASGDVNSRARAEALLHSTGCEAVMVGRAAQGNPWLLGELAGRDGGEPTPDEVAAELVRFVRETVRELGEHRGIPFLRKFHGWYLRRGGFPRTLRQDLSRREHGRGGRGAAVRGGAGRPRARGGDGGRAGGAGRRQRRRGARAADLDLRRGLGQRAPSSNAVDR